LDMLSYKTYRHKEHKNLNCSKTFFGSSGKCAVLGFIASGQQPSSFFLHSPWGILYYGAIN
jgi:hypothetical protein